MSDIKWMNKAMCKGQPTRWWFPERGDKGEDARNFKVAKRICRTCGVSKQCFNYGMDTNSVGVFGGIAMRGRFQRDERSKELDLQSV